MSASEHEIRTVFPAGHRIFIEGEKGDVAFIIERGRVEIAFERNGRSVRVAILGQGEIFGEMALIDDRPRSATATALVPTEVVIVRREQIRSSLKHADSTVRLLLEVLLGRFRAMQGRLDWMATDGESPGAATRDLRDKATESHTEALDRLKFQREIEHAIETGAFRLQLQPIVSLKDGNVEGFEALVRWDHAERGAIPPSQFIQLAETADLVQGIDRWVVGRVIDILARLQREHRRPAGDKPTYIAVNLSGHSIADDRVIAEVKHGLREVGVDPKRLRLEITEGALIDNPKKVSEVLDDLAAVGVRAGIDDFGTGYSSLAYLVGFAIRTLKIDRAFVQSMLSNDNSQEIVRAIIGMAHALGIEVVAEGVESLEQLHALWRMECECIQGFLLSRPLEVETAVTVARSGPMLSTGPVLLGRY